MLGFTEAMKYFFLICCFCFVLLILLIACDMLRDVCARIKQKLREKKSKRSKIYHLELEGEKVMEKSCHNCKHFGFYDFSGDPDYPNFAPCCDALGIMIGCDNASNCEKFTTQGDDNNEL